jgi:2-C-methyl-D-erythritol 4-phosphate cytidylyltransferase
LGVSVRDTMKQVVGASEVTRTVPREDLWHAFTPQMFRLGLLRRALRQAVAADQVVTDDASAMELMGLAPLMVEGHSDNIKVTRQDDFALARFYLQQQGRLC